MFSHSKGTRTVEELFIGSALCEVTAGGEILLPRSFHETARARAPDGRLFVGLHEESPCLVVYDKLFAAQQQWEMDNRKTAFLGPDMEAHHSRLRRIFGFVEQVVLAPDGMMIIAPLMRQRGRLGATALLVATGQRFEVWDLDFVLERAPADIITLATLHLEDYIANEENNDFSLQYVDAQRRTARTAQPRLRLQQVQAVRPRHDPVAGIGSGQMESRTGGISRRLEEY